MRPPYQSYSTQQWQQIMDNYSRSSLNQKAFCQQEGLAMSTFSKWRKQLGLANTHPGVDAAADFKPFISASPLSGTAAVANSKDHSDWDMELILGAGIILRLRMSV